MTAAAPTLSKLLKELADRAGDDLGQRDALLWEYNPVLVSHAELAALRAVVELLAENPVQIARCGKCAGQGGIISPTGQGERCKSCEGQGAVIRFGTTVASTLAAEVERLKERVAALESVKG